MMVKIKMYNGLSKQRKDILEIIKKLKKATPGDVVNIDKNIKNVYPQLDRLLQDGYIKRIDDRAYALTQRGLLVFDKKKTISITRNLRFSDVEIQQFEFLAKQPDVLNRLAELLNPALLGLYPERLACLLAFVSNDDINNDRNRIHVLLCGETSTGKSAIIEWMHTFIGGYLMDSSARRSGIEGTGKGYQFSPGLLQQADNSVLYVDELDKMPFPEQNTLLRAMESGKVSVNKDRVNREVFARIRVIGTCNEKNAVREALRSRFDLILDINALNKEDINKLISKRFNDWCRPKRLADDLSLKRYLLYANQIPTKLPEDREMMASIIEEELNCGQLRNRDIRQLESIPRIMLALGKLKLKTEAGMEELKDTIKLLS